MNTMERFAKLREFVLEIKEYYDRSAHLADGTLVISQQMASLALPELSAAELSAFIRSLEEHGYVTVVKKEPLSFTPNFID
jgi:uncharacterized protein YpbB